jgi:molybdopterin/thiamine biosynthesis adenylyltransferase/rhodanese-related sulfurtransferase
VLPVMLTDRDRRRYSRHLVLPEVGVAGQEKLKVARVLVVGAGGLGSPVALYLAAAGVGRLGIVDFDVVDESNLQRQVLYGQGDVGDSKVEVARRRLLELNPLIDIEVYHERLGAENVRSLLADYEIVVDGSDNFATRYLVNDACVLMGTTNVHGSIYRFEGQVSVFGAPDGPCYRCLFREPPPAGLVPSCADGGVFGVLPGIVGSLQATEVIKLVVGIGSPLIGRMLLVEALNADFRELKLAKDPECPVCGANPTITGLASENVPCPDSSETAQELEVEPRQVDAWMKQGEDVVLLDVRTPLEVGHCRLPSSVFVPLLELPQRLEELDSNRRIVVYCHHGIRSAQAVAFLRGRGFERAINLAGGIEAWSRQVDPSIPRY